MAVFTLPKAPGVYVDEVDLPSFSISSSATAVPVILDGNSGSLDWWKALGEKPALINSFADVLSYFSASGSKSESVAYYSPRAVVSLLSRLSRGGPAHHPRLADAMGVNTKTADVPDWDRHTLPALKAYFDNGGGYCYLLPRDKLEWLDKLPDVTLVVQAGQSTVTSDILKYTAEGSGRFALLDGPEESKGDVKGELETALGGIQATEHAAVYYPWLKANWSIPGVTEIANVAPSAVAAGIICRTDNSVGPWKAPANAAVSSGLSPLVKVGSATQALFTSGNHTTKSVNILREFKGRGLLLWGARTLTTGGNAWGYVPVRRTFDMAERDIGRALESVLFEPNGQATWEAVRAAVENYLYNLWKKGALQGNTPEEAFFIQVGLGVTMTQADIDNGILKARIGIAVVRPAEFIVLEFSQQVASGA
ncbi:phage tail sheath family protein [Candidatus Pantoea multigeneris]|uniref:Phage tail sheath family protein n=1 Tax=Candidatus Pantoea multigeneris TaxID=2608357 RepID=A0ABX0RA31_9GAMM|nr:phage tail sheath family protein [Pantoea multigeneris]NIF20559.1 phage tail sheath family protein [Pantoea multigeneris]